MSDEERPFELVALLERMGVDAGLPAEEVGRALGASRQEVVRWRTWGMDHAQAGALAELNGLAFSSVWKRDGTAARPGRERQPAGFVEPTTAALAEVDAEQPEPEPAASTPQGDPPEPLRCPWQYQPGAEPCGFAAKGQQGLRTHLSLIHKVRGHSKEMVAERARLLAVATGGEVVDDVGEATALAERLYREGLVPDPTRPEVGACAWCATCGGLIMAGFDGWHHHRPLGTGVVEDEAHTPEPCCVNTPEGQDHHPSCPTLIVDAEIVDEEPPEAEAVPADPFRAALTALDREHEDLVLRAARLADELGEIRRRKDAVKAAIAALVTVIDG